MEKRNFIFEDKNSHTQLFCTMESDYHARSIKLKFDLSSIDDGEPLNIPFADNQKSQLAKSVINHAKKPFNSLTEVLSDAFRRNPPLVQFSRPYTEVGESMGEVDIILDKTADFKKVLTALTKQLVSHKNNLDHQYTYNPGVVSDIGMKRQTYGWVEVATATPQERKPDAYKWTEKEMRAAEFEAREGEPDEERRDRILDSYKYDWKELNKDDLDSEGNGISDASSEAGKSLRAYFNERPEYEQDEPRKSIGKKILLLDEGLGKQPVIASHSWFTSHVDRHATNRNEHYTGRQ